MSFLASKTLSFLFGCLLVWAAANWLGVAVVALVLAVLALTVASMSLESANRHSAELKELRERLATVEANHERSHDRLGDRLAGLELALERTSQRLRAVTPSFEADDD